MEIRRVGNVKPINRYRRVCGREATNDNNAENLNISYICGNVVDFFVNFQEKRNNKFI